MIRVLVATDNHVGFAEADPVRGIDSVAAFEEVLQLARAHGVDMVLLGGDLFHENKPSRATVVAVMDLLRRYCMCDNPVRLEVVSDARETLASPVVNYEDTNLNIGLPVFSIHGNHDDPLREGKHVHSAMDVLSTAGLVNYFGRARNVEVRCPCAAPRECCD